LSALVLAQPAFAAETDQRLLSVSAGASYVTHKSKLVESNDVGLAYNYGLRVLGGGSGSILVDARGSMGTVSFELNGTSIAQQELLCLFGWNFGWGYVGAGAGTRQLKATLEDGEIETYSRTYGGMMGVQFGLFRGTSFYTDVSGTMPLETKETQQQEVEVGLALNGEMGATFDLTRKSLDLSLGVRYSTLAVDFGGKGGGEVMTAPFLGLRWGFDP
jgi:hypothetical protein